MNHIGCDNKSFYNYNASMKIKRQANFYNFGVANVKNPPAIMAVLLLGQVQVYYIIFLFLKITGFTALPLKDLLLSVETITLE